MVFGMMNINHLKKLQDLLLFRRKEIDTEQLENLLKKIFEENPNILESAKQAKNKFKKAY